MTIDDLLKSKWVHLCVDMQRIFYNNTDWRVVAIDDIKPPIEQIVSLAPSKTIFTCFTTPTAPEDAYRAWQDYYHKWYSMTASECATSSHLLIEEFEQFSPPARRFRKQTYSPWISGELHQVLLQEGVEHLVITGVETDVCVLGTVLGAIDLGYRVVLVEDAICSSSSVAHDAILKLFRNRFSAQVTVCTTEELLGALA